MMSFTTLIAFLPVLASSVLAASTPAKGTTYSIHPASFPDLCVAPEADKEGAKLIVTDCDSSSDIAWTFDGSALHNSAADKCVDITDGATWSGNKPQIWGCYAWNGNQKFKLDGGLIKWTGKNQCLDLTDGSGVEGNSLQIWSCHEGNNNQQWVFNEVEEVDGCDDSTSGETGSITPTTGDAEADDCADEAQTSESTDSAVASPSVTIPASAANASSSNGTSLGDKLWADGHQHQSSSSAIWSQSSSDEWSASSTSASSAKASATGSADSSSGNADMSGYIQTSGTKLVDSSGNNVVLKGTNLGGWLVWEDWMCGITDNSGSADRFPQTTLENRFGVEKAYELLNVWQDNWLVSSDFDVLAGMGFNVVRVPFSYLNFMYRNGTYIYGADGDLDYSRLDWVVSEAKKRGIYVIPTFHIWDGQEERYSTVSEDSQAGRDQRKKMGELWTKIAAHFAGESAIAAYDAINEPTGSANNNLQRDLYKAIRKGDSKRVIVMESISAAPDGDWTNVVYSMHEYLMMGDDTGYNKNMFNQGVVGDVNAFSGQNLPSYIGEFMASDETLTWMLNKMNDMGVSWSGWTYKTVNMDRWGLYNFGWKMRVDVSSDSFDSIRTTWSNMGGTSKSRVVDQYTAAAGGSKWKRDVPETQAPEAAPVVASPRVQDSTPAIMRSSRHGGRSRRMAGMHGVAKLR